VAGFSQRGINGAADQRIIFDQADMHHGGWPWRT
jgi:hypothetical protein